jgi:hypothetical protein
MGIRAVFRAGQQSLAKEISTDFANDFKQEDAVDFSTNLVSNTVKQTKRGRSWNFVRGIWGISSSKLAPTSAADYPITVVDALVPDVEITLNDVGQGAGAALWYTDSGNWWGVATKQTSTSCNCSTYYYSCNPVYHDGCCAGYEDVTCLGDYVQTGYYGTYYCVDTVGIDKCVYDSCATQVWKNYNFTFGYTNYQCQGGEVCNYKVWGTVCNADYYTITTYCTYKTIRYVCTQGGCGYTTYSTCSGQSCETCYPQYIRVIQSVANQVSEIVSWSLSAVVRSLKIKTKSKTITIDAYSDTELSSRIDYPLNYDATTASESTKFGLLAAPSSANESRSASKINIRRNK